MLYMYTHTYVHVCRCISTYAHISMYISMYVHVYPHVYIYIGIDVYILTFYKYIYISMFTISTYM